MAVREVETSGNVVYEVDAPGFLDHHINVWFPASCGDVRNGLAIDIMHKDGRWMGGVVSLADMEEIVRRVKAWPDAPEEVRR